MSRVEVNQSISLKLVVYDRVKADGTSPIYLRVTIDRKKRDISLKSYWPKQFFDEARQIAMPRHAKDNDVKTLNMILEDVKGKANRIKVQYYTANKKLTLDAFVHEMDTYESRDNFLIFWESKMDSMFNEGLITARTHMGYKSNLNKLKSFLNGAIYLSMSDITPEFIRKYQNWLIRGKGEIKGLKYNTAVKAVKTMQTFFRMLPDDGFKVNRDAFAKASKKYVAGERQALEQDELKALKAFFAKNVLPEIGQEVLRKFLFSCYTGLRISDSANVTSSMITQDKLTVRMIKGERFGKEVTIKLAEYARELVKGRKGHLFSPIPDPVCNRWLKDIADRVGIEKNLTFHVARDTFATIFIELGGDVATLMKLMGHSSIKTTQIYMKMSENRAEKLMDNFDKL